MEISSPKDPVYYYECSAGKFRLVYFIPPGRLRRLHEEGQISEQALNDLPDGVDLGCTEPDFAEFEELYGYRPPLAPEALLRAFFTIFSSTRDWETFRGSGFVPAAELESQAGAVEEELKRRNLEPSTVRPLPDRPTLKERRERLEDQTVQEARIQEALRELPGKGVDGKKTLREQFKVDMGPGKPAEQVFAELHQRQRR